MMKAGQAALERCMYKAMRGETLVIGFLGGSVTEGSLASAHENTYAYRVFSWWKETFPNTRFFYVNGGIGGTDSFYGTARAVTDVLMYQPDVVVVDFSVNDAGNYFYQETYEGLIRKLLAWKSAPAVLLLHNVYYDTGMNAQEFHRKTGEWYQLAQVSIKDTIYQKMKQGIYRMEELTPDGLHPNDAGHKLVAGEIIRFLETVKTNLQRRLQDDPKSLPEAAAAKLPAPLTANAYEYAKRLTIREISPELSGFRADTEEKKGHLDHFKNGWIGEKPGDRMAVVLEASCIGVQYRKTVRRPAMRARLVLDGDREHPFLLDGNFEEDWGDCQYLLPVLHHGERGKHVLEVEILPDEEQVSKTPFYLMAFIVA